MRLQSNYRRNGKGVNRDYTNDYCDSLQIIIGLNKITQNMLKLCGLLINKVILDI